MGRESEKTVLSSIKAAVAVRQTIRVDNRQPSRSTSQPEYQTRLALTTPAPKTSRADQNTAKLPDLTITYPAGRKKLSQRKLGPRKGLNVTDCGLAVLVNDTFQVPYP